MAKSSPKQVIPFPLPPYLASYFANKISGEPLQLDNGTIAKPFSVTRKSNFGRFIFRSLTKANRPKFNNKGFTFFIEVSEWRSPVDKISEDARYSFLELNEQEIKEITSVFKSVFEEALFSFVAGAKETFFEFTNKQRGYLQFSIKRFCDLNGVIYTNQNFEAWRQATSRALRSGKMLKSKVL